MPRKAQELSTAASAWAKTLPFKTPKGNGYL